MWRWIAVPGAVFVVIVACSAAAYAQAKPACDAKGRVMTPEKVEGVVVYIDHAQNRLSVREADNKVHDFQASKETLEDLKVGDRIEANLKEAPKCP
jgi:anti-sigma-K factor RskA